MKESKKERKNLEKVKKINYLTRKKEKKDTETQSKIQKKV